MEGEVGMEELRDLEKNGRERRGERVHKGRWVRGIEREVERERGR